MSTVGIGNWSIMNYFENLRKIGCKKRSAAHCKGPPKFMFGADLKIQSLEGAQRSWKSYAKTWSHPSSV